MKMSKFVFIFILIGCSNAFAGALSGMPIQIMKTDYAGMNLTFIKFSEAVGKGNCTSGSGVVLHDSNDSSTIGVSLALTALASGKTFSCWNNSVDSCSRITGSIDTYPVCDYYPSILN